MAAHNTLTALERSLLRALLSGSVMGLRALAERAEGRPLRDTSDLDLLSRYVAAIRTLMDRNMLYKTHNSASLRLNLTRAGRRAVIHQEPIFSRFARLATSLATVTAFAAITGCAVQDTMPIRKPLMGFPTVTGLGQVRDPQTGAAYFVPCNPCAAPTVKTPVAVIAEENLLPARPTPIMQPQRPIVATLAEPRTPIVPRAEQEPARIVAAEAAVGHVLFGSASARLDAAGLATVNGFAARAKAAAAVTVSGQVDNTGTPAGNRRLALARAQAVRSALVAAGVPAAKIKTGYCTTCYPASNDTEEGRKQNRRAEISISNHTVKKAS